MDSINNSLEEAQPVGRKPITGDEFRTSLREQGEMIINWFMSQERKLFNDSVVTASQAMIDRFLDIAQDDPSLSIDAALEVLTLLLVKYHHLNIRSYRDQIPQTYKGMVDVIDHIDH